MPDALAHGALLARRNLAHVRQVPERLLEVTLQPIVLVLLFVYIFGSAIDVPGGSYREYLIPGVLVQALALGIMGPATAVAEDLTHGLVDRFNTLPTARSAFLLGHLIASLAAAALATTVMVATGFVVGWRVHASPGHVLAAAALLAAFALAIQCLGLLLGATVRSPEAVGGVVFVTVFPLTFLCNVFVPAGGLPAGLRAIAEWNPISAIVAAVREQLGNPAALPADPPWPLQHALLAGFVWSLAIAAIAGPLAVRRYRARTTG